jgi:hypothetical protein
MTSEEPCASHALVHGLMAIARGELKELPESDLFEYGVRAPWEEEEVPSCDSCVGEPPANFKLIHCSEEEYGGFRTWEQLAEDLKLNREEALDDPETWGVEFDNPSPTQRVERAQQLLKNSFEFDADAPTPFGLAATLGDQTIFAWLETAEWRTMTRGYLVSLSGVFATEQELLSDRALRGTYQAELIGLADVDRMDAILEREDARNA